MGVNKSFLILPTTFNTLATRIAATVIRAKHNHTPTICTFLFDRLILHLTIKCHVVLIVRMSRLHAFPLAKIIIVIHLFTFSELRYFGPNRSHCLIYAFCMIHGRRCVLFSTFYFLTTFWTNHFHALIILLLSAFVNPCLEQFFNFL